MVIIDESLGVGQWSDSEFSAWERLSRQFVCTCVMFHCWTFWFGAQMHLKIDILLFIVLWFITEEEIWRIQLRGYPLKIDIKHFSLHLYLTATSISSVFKVGAWCNGVRLFLLSNPVIRFGFSLTKWSGRGWVLRRKHFILTEESLCNR